MSALVAVEQQSDVELKVAGEETQEESQAKFEGIESAKWEINFEHLKFPIQELNELMAVSDEFSSLKLLDVFDEIEITEEDYKLWACYGDSGSVFSGKPNTRSRLKTVLDYAETNNKASKHVKNKLRIVSKLILEDPKHEVYKPVGVLLLLAAHGNVCNVQKEVGINCAFGMMTNSLKDFVDGQTLEQSVYRLLRDWRYLLVEELYKTFKATNNIHSIVMMTNELAPHIGVEPIVDPNISNWGLPGNWKEGLSQKYFKDFYNHKRIVQFIQRMISEKKISYQKMVKFLESNAPALGDLSEDANRQYQFLSAAIDMETAKLREPYLCWFLGQLKIFQPYTGKVPDQLNPIKIEESKQELVKIEAVESPQPLRKKRKMRNLKKRKIVRGVRKLVKKPAKKPKNVIEEKKEEVKEAEVKAEKVKKEKKPKKSKKKVKKVKKIDISKKERPKGKLQQSLERIEKEKKRKESDAKKKKKLSKKRNSKVNVNNVN